MKPCSQCRKLLPLSFFYADNTKRIRYQSLCKHCKGILSYDASSIKVLKHDTILKCANREIILEHLSAQYPDRDINWMRRSIAHYLDNGLNLQDYVTRYLNAPCCEHITLPLTNLRIPPK